MNVTLVLADSAQASDGKLHALGMGWTHTASPLTAPMAVGIIFHVPWTETNRKIKWTLDLVDADGNPVKLPTPTGNTAAVHIENQLEVGRPAGIKQGSEINVPFAVAIGPMPLPADSTFVWVLTAENTQWRVSFSTRPLPNKT